MRYCYSLPAVPSVTATLVKILRGAIPYHTIVIRTHDGPKKHVSPYVYTPYLVLNTTVCPPWAIRVVIRTHDGPKNHVFPYVYTPYLVLITTVCPPWAIAKIRTHDGPKNHVLPNVYLYTPCLGLITMFPRSTISKRPVFLGASRCLSAVTY